MLTAPQSPWQNAYVERLIGSIRRECLDHVIVLNETGLRRTLKSYSEYYERTRTHLSLGRTHPLVGQFNKLGREGSSKSRKLVGSIIATNESPSDQAVGIALMHDSCRLSRVQFSTLRDDPQHNVAQISAKIECPEATFC